MTDDPLRTLWMDSTEEDPMTVDVIDLRSRQAELDRDVARRNQRELFAGGLVVAIFGARALWAWSGGSLWEAVGSGMVVAGALFVSWWILTRGQPLAPEPAVDTRTFLEQRQAELLHQAALLEAVPYWYLGPILPGLAVLTVADWPGSEGGVALVVWSLGAVALVGLTVGIAWLNLRAARQLRAEAAELDRPVGR